MSGLATLPLRTLARGLAARLYSSLEATSEAIAAARRAQQAFNCFAHIDEERALAAARAADQRLARGMARGPLEGVPLAHKDMFERAGSRAGCGTPATQSEPVAAVTATVLARLDAAGQVQFATLHMSEWAYGPSGHNWHYGHCRNPWNPERITGGSSSGAGASVAARANFGALGSDTGGSIRLPAHFCGVAGLKPTYGRVSRAGAMPLSPSLDTIGPLARRVEDCALLFQLVAGRDEADPTTSARPVPDCLAALEAPISGLRLGVPENFFFERLDPHIERLVRDAIEVYRALGCRIVPVAVPVNEDWAHAAAAILAGEASALHLARLRVRRERYSEQVRARLEAGLALPAAAYVNALRLRARALAQWLEGPGRQADAVIAPCVAFATPGIAESDVGGDGRMDAVLASLTRFMRPANFLGAPALAVPCGFQPDGMPCAFQLMGRPWDEATLLALGHAYERETGWHERAPSLSA